MDEDEEMRVDSPRVAPAKEDKPTGANLPWIEKFRPKGLDEIISNEDIIATITRLIENNKLPNLLLYGPPGTGKTSTILACARKLNGPRFSSMVLELNASDERGIDVVREQIKDFASTRQIFSGGFKLVILDEADMMTKDAQFALRRVMEKYAKNTRFCLICNYVGKIIPALQSRCTRFRFSPLQPEHLKAKLRDIAAAETVALTEDGLEAIITLARGDMRKCLNILQATHMSFGKADAASVYGCTGQPQPADIEYALDLLLNESVPKAYSELQALQVSKGIALVDLLNGLHSLVLLMDIDQRVQAFLVEKLADLEHRLSVSVSERVQLGSLVGMFAIARAQLSNEAPIL